MFKARKIGLWAAAVCILLFACAVSSKTALAVGEGDGGGGGPAVPLYMDWSYPADGERGVSVTPVIQCKFSHNVAQYEVKKRNATLFSLTKADGTAVPFKVYIADAQLEFDKRQYIYLTPVRPLETNTTYIVSVKEGIQAKNGMVTEEPQSFRFTTGRITVPLAAEAEDTTTGSDAPGPAAPVTSPEAGTTSKTDSEKTEGGQTKPEEAPPEATGTATGRAGGTNSDLAAAPGAGAARGAENGSGPGSWAVWVLLTGIAAGSCLLAAVKRRKENKELPGESGQEKEAEDERV